MIECIRLKTYKFLLILGCCVILFGGIFPHHTFGDDASRSQLPPTDDPTGLYGSPPPITQYEVPSSPPDHIPNILPPVTPIPEDPEGSPPLKVFVKEVRIVGTTVLTPQELTEVVKPYLNQELTTEQLEELRRAITLQYVQKGYITSGAILPDQRVANGVITFQVIEGKLSDIHIEGTEWFRPSYFSSRLNLSAGPPVNLNQLRDRLQLFIQDQRIARINSELQPGLKPGLGVLNVRVQETNPWRAWAEFNNYQSPTVGAERGLFTLANLNPLGLGDSISVTWGISEGVDPLIDGSYAIPFTPWDTTFIFQYRKNDFSVVESPFKPLDIKSKTEIFTLSIRQPIYRSPTQEFAITLIGERLENKNFLLGIPFSFTPGTTAQGKAIFSVLRFAQEWVDRRPNQVLSARSRFSLGLDVLGATIHSSSSIPDGQFFTWLGQAQAAHRFDPYRIQVITRMDLQLANDRLFPLEQYALGGRYTVRGYRENQLVRDNAFLWTIESRIPVLPSILGLDTVQFAPFIDVGRSWDAKGNTQPPQTLASIGAGLRFSFHQQAHPLLQQVQASIYWGQQLNHLKHEPQQNLQDHGIHVQVVLTLL
ncbi:MAG: ShlB/FhaC/HecB family hemolysin secretion/activation protein [Nitrospirales bacterium]|nr:ShlB/FhaC/HecB family hemolysin secretion/activation protein [Nitrospira sp.]MDR4501561.1 ShlB/FhaC/HecB family hemolysin secretion/activation protein [Nitrospirales bacterium]